MSTSFLNGHRLMALCGVLMLLGVGTSVRAVPRTWMSNTTGEWSVAANWVENEVPGPGDDVLITNVGSRVILSGSSPEIGSLTLNRTLVCTNWDTVLNATRVTVQDGGLITLPSAFTDSVMSNRVHIVCSNLTIETGGSINALGKGYAGGDSGSHRSGYGRGAGLEFRGGGYGGRGGANTGTSGATYGVTNAPIDLGSGGGGYSAMVNVGGAGGGAILLEVCGHAVVNGTVTADGGMGAGSGNVWGGGSGGSVYLTCGTFAGTNGTIRANGGGASYALVRSGGGGRIAVVAANRIAQDNLPVPTVGFSANVGMSGTATQKGEFGTVYLSHGRFLPPLLTSDYNGRFGGSDFATRAYDTLTVSNGLIGTLETDTTMIVSNDVRVVSGGRLDVNNLSVGGSVRLEGGGALYVWSGATNAGGAEYGALVAVTNDFYVGTNCVVYPWSHATNGGSVLFSLNNLLVTSAGKINADGTGFGAGSGPGRGTGYGGGGYGGSGAGYNGSGHGGTYGSSNAPAQPGSGGASSGGRGGGLIWVEADTITVNGTLTAGGQDPVTPGYGAGSGGGIYLVCDTFAGAAGGKLRANGGNTWRTGGGGRIAVWRTHDTSGGSVSTAVNPGTGGTSENPTSTVGTVVWGFRQSAGAVPVNVQGDPVEAGKPSPHDYGLNAMTPGVETTERVTTPADETNGSRYICIGWSMTNEMGGSQSDTSSEATFVVATNTTLTWYWAAQHRLDTSAVLNGSLLSDESDWYMSTSDVSVTAVADAGYAFLQWGGSGVPDGMHTNNPLTVTMDRPRSVHALFHNQTATKRVWNGTGNWFTDTNWYSPLGVGVPGPEDDVVIESGTNTLTAPITIGSLTVSNKAVLVFLNTTNTLLVSGAVQILSGAMLTHGVQSDTNGADGWVADNGIRIECADFLIQAGGTIDVSAKGYAGGDFSAHLAGYGPGAGLSYRGGGYGGQGGADTGVPGATYGVTNAPIDPGSGGGGYAQQANVGGAGGGVVRLDVSGHAVVSGMIAADGGAGMGSGGVWGGGSGGSVYLACGTFSGTNGTIRANGGGASHVHIRSGGGGRIAVVATNCTAQDNLPVPTVGLSANAGMSGTATQKGEFGTVYLSHGRFLPPLLTSDYNGRFGGSDFATRAYDTLTVSNGLIGTLETDTTMIVSNDVRVVSGGRLDVNNLSVGGSVRLEGGSALHVWSGATNAGGAEYGAQVAVANDFYVGTNCVVYPWSHAVNGGSVLFSLNNLLVTSAGQINADGTGFGAGSGPGHGTGGGAGGYGGSGASSSGSGHGGTYGSSNAPAQPGSGGASSGGRGGGLIWVEAAATITVNGTLTAGGQNPVTPGYGAGSGGGIYLVCHTFAGAPGGKLRANGGDTWRTGGGGRVAVWRRRDSSGGTVSASADAGTGGTSENPVSAPGTVVWDWLRAASGTVILVR